MPVTFNKTNWNDTLFEVTTWTDPTPFLNATLAEWGEQNTLDVNTDPLSKLSAVEVLEDARYIPLLVVGCLSSLLSILGSSSVLYMVRRDFQTKHRLIFGLSLADLISSTALLVMPFSVPSYLGLTAAVGTHATCTASGFFMQTNVLIGACYNCYLSFYYILVVKRNWQEGDFHKRKGWEIAGHGFAVVVPTAIGILGAATQSINSNKFANNVCLYSPAPWGCGNDSDVHCTRSSLETTRLIGALTSLFLTTYSIVGFVCTALVCCAVSDNFRRSGNYRFEGDQPSATNQRLRQVKTQAFLYSLVYLNSFIWPVLVQVMTEKAGTDIATKKLEPGYYILQLVLWALFPLQGFLNFFVFTRNKVTQWKKAAPNRSALWVYKQVLVDAPLPRRGRAKPPRRSLTMASTRSTRFFGWSNKEGEQGSTTMTAQGSVRSLFGWSSGRSLFGMEMQIEEEATSGQSSGQSGTMIAAQCA